MASNCIYCEYLNSYVRNGIDRLNSDIGYKMNNVVPCCYNSNRAKMDMPVDEFLNYLSRFGANKAIIFNRIIKFQESLMVFNNG